MSVEATSDAEKTWFAYLIYCVSTLSTSVVSFSLSPSFCPSIHKVCVPLCLCSKWDDCYVYRQLNITMPKSGGWQRRHQSWVVTMSPVCKVPQPACWCCATPQCWNCEMEMLTCANTPKWKRNAHILRFSVGSVGWMYTTKREIHWWFLPAGNVQYDKCDRQPTALQHFPMRQSVEFDSGIFIPRSLGQILTRHWVHVLNILKLIYLPPSAIRSKGVIAQRSTKMFEIGTLTFRQLKMSGKCTVRQECMPHMPMLLLLIITFSCPQTKKTHWPDSFDILTHWSPVIRWAGLHGPVMTGSIVFFPCLVWKRSSLTAVLR